MTFRTKSLKTFVSKNSFVCFLNPKNACSFTNHSNIILGTINCGHNPPDEGILICELRLFNVKYLLIIPRL